MEERVQYVDGGGAVLEVATFQGATFTTDPTCDIGHHIQSLSKIPFKENDVLVTSYPKSGTCF